MKKATLRVWFKDGASAAIEIRYVGDIDLGLKMWKWIGEFPVRPIRLQLDL